MRKKVEKHKENSFLYYCSVEVDSMIREKNLWYDDEKEYLD